MLPAQAKKYVETVSDERLFEQAGKQMGFFLARRCRNAECAGVCCLVPGPKVYLQYTSEYLKGPLYWHPDKLRLARSEEPTQ